MRTLNRIRQGSEDHVESLRGLPLDVLAEVITDRLNERAGRHALDGWEMWVQRSCRRRYGLYQPGDTRQAAFIDRLHLLRDQVNGLDDQATT